MAFICRAKEKKLKATHHKF